MDVLLDSGALVNAQNNAGSTPFFLATEALHKTPSLVCGCGWGGRNTLCNLTRLKDLHVRYSPSKAVV